MLATIRDDTWNIQHINPNSKRLDYSNIPGCGTWKDERTRHMVEGDLHLVKHPNPHHIHSYTVTLYVTWCYNRPPCPCNKTSCKKVPLMNGVGEVRLDPHFGQINFIIDPGIKICWANIGPVLACLSLMLDQPWLDGGSLLSWGGSTKSIRSILLFSGLFTIDKTLVMNWISCSYLIGVAASQMRQHLSNMKMIKRS